jgi:hypothetical protein
VEPHQRGEVGGVRVAPHRHPGQPEGEARRQFGQGCLGARAAGEGLFCDSLTGGARAEAALAELAPRLALGLTRVPMRRKLKLPPCGV